MKKLLWLAGVVLAACTTVEESEQLAQPIGPSAGIGDINLDGVIDRKDAADWLSAWGITIYTYGLTDDTYNTGVSLARRPYDWQVKMYADACLPTGKQPLPVDKVPYLFALANQYARLPTQYLRELGRQHYGIFIFGELGRIHKRWSGTANGQPMELVVYRSGPGTVAKARFGAAAFTQYGAWETLDQVSVDTAHGTLRFHRASADEWFTGTVDAVDDGTSIGHALSGTFTYLGGTYNFSATANYRGGGTTMEHGFGAPATGCNPDTDGNDIYTGTWSYGTTPPGIAVMIGGLGNETSSHELGHAIRWIVDDQRLGFLAADATKIESLFPTAGNAAAQCKGCSSSDAAAALVGSGYVTNYAASVNSQEDFASVWGKYVSDPTTLDNRIAADLAAGSTVLRDKRDFVRDKIDTPEPGPAAAIHPATGQPYRFVAGNPMVYSTPATYGAIAAASRMSPSVVSDEASKLWLFANGTDNVVYVQSIDSANRFSGFRSLGLTTDLPTTPVRVAAGVLGLFVVQNGTIVFRLLDGNGAVTAGGTITALPTTRSIAAATLGGVTYLFALDSQGLISYTRATYNGTTLQASGWTGVGNAPTSSIAAARVGSVIELAEIDGTQRVAHERIDTTNHFSGWSYDPLYATATALALDGGDTLYLKGFDGKVYAHPLGSSTAYAQIPGL